MSIEPTIAAENRREPWFRRLPVVSHFNKSVGLQRGMLVAGLVLTALFLLTAIFAPLIAPYGFSQISDAEGSFPAQQAPAAGTCSAPPSAATTCSPGLSGARRPPLW